MPIQMSLTWTPIELLSTRSTCATASRPARRPPSCSQPSPAHHRHDVQQAKLIANQRPTWLNNMYYTLPYRYQEAQQAV